jgi:hypothetical protein
MSLHLIVFVLFSTLFQNAFCQDITSTLNEIFKDGTFNGMKVQGSVDMKTGTDFSLGVVTSISNNGWALESSFTLKDGKCDFREVMLGAKLNIIPPENYQNVMKALGLPAQLPVSSFEQKVSFLPADRNMTTLPASTTVDAVQPNDVIGTQVKAVLGADAQFTIKNPVFMVTGFKFQLFFKASVMGPSASACSMTAIKMALQAQDPTLCTSSGGIEIPEINLGKQLKLWMAATNQPSTYIDATDGTITVGTDGLHCNLSPVAFSMKGTPGSTLNCLGEADRCQSAVRNALVAAVNAQLPPGYTVDASQFDNLKITVDPTTGDVTINGDIYAGAGKDPSALVQALRDYVKKGGVIKIDGKDVTDIHDIKDNGDCLNHPDRVAAKACSPGDEPPSSEIPGGKTTRTGFGNSPSSYLPDKSGDWSRGKGDGPKDGNQTVVIIGTVLITLAVVASLVGAVIVVKMIRKRSHTTNPANSFSRMNDSHDGDNFDSIALEQNYSNGREQQAVWGDVVELRKVSK